MKPRFRILTNGFVFFVQKRSLGIWWYIRDYAELKKQFKSEEEAKAFIKEVYAEIDKASPATKVVIEVPHNE